MHFLKTWIVGLTLAFSTTCIAEDAPDCDKILQYIQKNLSTTGVLKQNVSDGYVYVDIDDAYVHELIKLIESDGYETPPYFNRAGAIGAHISVIYPSEIKKYNIGKISENGQNVSFKITGCQVVRNPDYEVYDSSYLLLVKAPALEAILTKYKVPKRELGLHITIGIKTNAASP